MRNLESIVEELDEQKIKCSENLQEASHDLKGNMTAIRMNLFLLEKAELSERGRELVKRLIRSTESLTQMLKNLLDLSRLEAGREEIQLSEFDVAETVRSLCESLKPMAEAENIELKCRGEATLPVQGDRLKLQRIVQNLLTNSLKYTEEGYAKVNWKPVPPDRWQLTVRDSGPGIDATHAAPFTNISYDDKASGKAFPSAGSDSNKIHSEGIGLSIVRQLCKILDGIIEIESEPGKGTTIHIIFPKNYPVD